MAAKRTIEIDADVATLIEKKADEAGLTPAQLVSSLVLADAAEATEAPSSELQRRWAAIESGEATVPHDEVERWLRTWGTAGFKPWFERE